MPHVELSLSLCALEFVFLHLRKGNNHMKVPVVLFDFFLGRGGQGEG